MSDVPAALRAIAFGTADGALWGAALDHGPRAIVLGGGDAGAGLADGLQWSETDAGAWRLAGDGVNLTVTPISPPDLDPDAEPRPGTPWTPGSGAELCRVQGSAEGAGGELEAVGVRATLPAPKSAKAASASARFVAAWLPGGAAFGLLSARPRRVENHDGDVVAAGLFDPEGWLAVSDPRLSTTYDAAGVPTRCNLELWVSAGEDEFPRRAAGEVSGPGGSVSSEGLALRVAPLRSHSRGEDGAGVYALATFG